MAFGDGAGPFDPFPGGFGEPGPGRSRFRISREDARARNRERLAGLVAVPIPVPIPSGNPFPFPTGPAANDPVFRRPPFGTGIGSVVLGGVIGVIIVETGIQVARRVAELKKKRKEDERKAEVEGIERRAERQRRDATVSTIPGSSPAEISEKIGGARSEIFQKIPRPRPGKIPEKSPVPIEIPDIEFPFPEPAPIPKPQPLELPSPLPVPLPRPAGLPAPKPIPGFGVPGPLPLPGANPFPFPGTSPFPASTPLRRPAQSPKRQPIGDLATPPNLTPINAPGVGSNPFTFTANQPQPETQTDKKCKEVKRRRRRKGKCMEGFYREYPMKTQFEEWREVDCTTRKEDPRPDDMNRDSKGRFT